MTSNYNCEFNRGVPVGMCIEEYYYFTTLKLYITFKQTFIKVNYSTRL